MPNDPDQSLRQHLLDLLKGGNAHVKFEDAIDDLAPKFRGQKPANLPHSPWMLLEHLRIAQWDILEFSRNPKHKSPKWPDGYWPESPTPPSDYAWEDSIEKFKVNLKTMQDLVADPKIDLFEPIKWGSGQTILREALLVADHNAYHIAQLVDTRRLLGAWNG
jgi:DinB superfamily